MKEKGLIAKTMHFLVHNSFLFTVAIMCIVHITLLVVMQLVGVTSLVNFNILSVVVYLFCILLCKFGHILPVYVSVLLEVTIYALVSTPLIGWSCGSYCFLCAIIPIIIYFGCFLFEGSQRWGIVIALVLDFAIFVFLYVCYAYEQPIYEIPHAAKIFLNIFASFVMVFSIIFYNVVYIYSSEYEMVILKSRNEQLSADAKEDVLTNLLNRRGFLPIVEDAIKCDAQPRFCIAFCDIDNFKRINDTYGHDCGDEVLRHITNILKRDMQGCDICRWGGEEFVILMKNYDFEEAKVKMENVRKIIETNPTVFYNKRILATITIGLEEYKEKFRESEAIIRVADERMYYGKQHGKNIVIFEDAM